MVLQGKCFLAVYSVLSCLSAFATKLAEENTTSFSCHEADATDLMQMRPASGKTASPCASPAPPPPQPRPAEPTYFPGFWPKYGGKRVVELLDGEWQWGLYNNDTSGWFHEDKIDAMAPIDTRQWQTPNMTQVPSSWDVAMPGIAVKRGVAVYRRTFNQEGPARLQFMACSFYCRVFVDGVEIGSHLAGGYAPFWLDVPAPANGNASRELFVLTDNRFNSTTAPMHQSGADFWMYGGIVRSVLLMKMPEAGTPWPWRAYVFPLAELGRIDVNISLTSAYSGSVEYELAFDGAKPSVKQTGIAESGTLILRNVLVPNARPWTLTSPNLHTMTITMHDASVIERFGLRHLSLTESKAQITLNGEAVKLQGFNRHTMWMDTGMSPTAEQLDNDFRLAVDGKASFIRGAHYPQMQQWLDRMDEAGIGFWEETLGPGTSVEDLESPYYVKYQLQQLNEMMEQSMNHPSVFMWGWMNEAPTDDEAVCPAFAANFQQAAWDTTRFRTYAFKFGVQADKCLEYADIVSENKYPGWYEGFRNMSYIQWYWDSEAAYSRQNYPGKPYFISEVGAGGIASWDDNATKVRWGVPYQAEVLNTTVQVFQANPDIAGMTIWQFSDIKANDQAQMCGSCNYLPDVEPPWCGSFPTGLIQGPGGFCFQAGRPGSLNNKGMVDAWRVPKESWDTVTSQF